MSSTCQDVLEKVATALPIIHKAFNGAIGISLTDTEKVLSYYPAKDLDFKTPINFSFREGSAVFEFMQKKLPYLKKRMDSQLHGFP
jgi:hypothetical protein